ncbi:uncharacterized protein LOC118464513 [Anopheles albimanus]|uniref:uncharacterized protein LOC118464513 n=1 Tax=Anopheles albimanus TaxID=7167 RepID=UPI00163FA706|nr:uncharacterized protein LOC118464513 [Anopheles albimanus]
MANPGSLRHLLRCLGSTRLVVFGGSEPLSRPLPGSLVNGLARNQSTAKNVSIRGSSRLYCTVSAATTSGCTNRGNSYRSSKRNSFIRSAIGHHEYSTAATSSTRSSSSSGGDNSSSSSSSSIKPEGML